MCFNDESVARAIVASPVPVITGIGHEPDTSIADMVADRRTSTPTAAAESVAPGIDDIQRQMIQRQRRLAQAMQTTLDSASAQLDGYGQRADVSMGSTLSRLEVLVSGYASRNCLQDPTAPLKTRRADLDQLSQRFSTALPKTLARQAENCDRYASRLANLGEHLTDKGAAQLSRYAASLDALSPLKVLSRGYAIAKDEAGHVVKSARDVAPGQDLTVQLGEGSVLAKVVSTSVQ